MAMKYDKNGNLIEIINGVRIVHTKDGLIVGEGLEAVLIRGTNLKLSDASNFVQGHYPDNYPFSAPHRHPEEDIYINFALDPEFPPDGIPLDRLPKVIRELKKLVASTTSVKTDFPPTVKDGMLVVWDEQKKQYVPATCPNTRADLAAGLFFNGVADLATGSVITASTVTNESWNLIEGKKYYLDCANPGMLTDKDTGYFVGIAQGPHTLYLAPLADSAESLITALETGLKAEEAARKAADNALKDRLDKRDESFCTDVKDCILGTSSGSTGGPDVPSGGIANDIFKPGGGLTQDPTTGKLILDCAAVKNCITGSGSSGGSGSSSGILSDIVLPNGGLTQDPETGKLKVDCAGIRPCQVEFITNSIKDGQDKFSYGLSYDSKTGKLMVDFDQMPASKMQAVFSSMIQQGGGLSVDPVTGKLFFDSLSMDTTVIENMMKTLRLPLYLPGHKDLYVDQSHANASDKLDDGRGESQSLPFKKIQPCINYACENFNFGQFDVTIHIGNGVYEEFLMLPDYTATTGSLILKPLNIGAVRNVQVHNPTGQVGNILSITGTKNYRIYNLALTNTINIGNLTSNIYPTVLNITNGSTRLFGISAKFEREGELPSGLTMNAILLSISGLCYLYCDDNLPMLLSLPATGMAGVGTYLMNVSGSNGQFLMVRERTAKATHKVLCSGAAFYGVQAEAKGSISQTGSGSNSFVWEVDSGKTFTGSRYRCQTGGSINTGGGGPEYFPGTSAGVVDSASFSYYA